jgi:hypothetical protein
MATACTCGHLAATHCKYYGCTQCSCGRFTPGAELGWKVVRQASAYRQPKTQYEGREDVARRRYERIARDLRQGKVELFDPAGNRVAFESGPMVRTRW